MKKTYIIPTTDEIVLKACGQLLAGSEIPGGGETGQNLAPDLFFDEDAPSISEIFFED